ncbi:ADP-ribosylglycohydrolase family protein [Gryllotalpicola koreensis]|uniref:ADP-ribosylglycohydrolase family protein n=1 Tax=Gryllotalpicola koreensis TaxID=993086 RepID=A0ABP8A045_9MICO
MTTDALVRGILAGEAMSPSTQDFRIRLLPPKRLARMEVLHRFAREHETTTLERPYAHSSPPGALHPGAGEAIEWFAFTARLVRAAETAGSPGPIHEGWQRLSLAEGVHARIGTRIALGNLRRGLQPPQSGHDNPHYFDDIAMARAAAVAFLEGPDDEALRLIVADSEVTHDLDGVWCAAATAVLVRRLLAGDDRIVATDAALEALPSESWSRRLAELARETAEGATSALDRSERLGRVVGDWVYSYPIAAPETLAFLLAHVRHAESANELLLGALSTGRAGATLAALAGGCAAVIFGEAWIPERLTAATAELTGLAVPESAGATVADALAEAAHVGN